ncbi:hypothetical protein RDV64_23555 (plasmid) [Acuticoccus sp. MNP-M23]|uniref:hypothetical protein n=1 Tax=Acuticoccus sp. MNP-M23 TaxID=3072793 RepID=UPI002816979F|nr:hypothetical protein [Acuticoccus sp. MNP-M23]WMS45314.1 hypothetical protein RDV64_23555 [Acuticoccus sp. MNP-M23]
MPTFRSLCPALLGILAMAACTSITPGGLVAASRLDPLNTPPGEIGVALSVPDAVRLTSADATLRIAFREDGAGSTTLVEETVPLMLTRDDAGLVSGAQAGETVYIAGLSPDDADRFAQAQADIRDARARGIAGSGSLSVSITGGCFVGARPETLPTRSWLRTSPSGGFVPLTRRVDAARVVGPAQAGALRGRLAPC